MEGLRYRPAVFLDRDGVLTEEKGYITRTSDLAIYPYARRCVARIREMGYLAVVVSNQAAVGMGLLPEKTLREMNEKLRRDTGVDAVYYCPHHPKAALAAYRLDCSCRKPAVGLFQRAAADFQIDLSGSYMIGDRASDILAGKRLGVKTVLLESGYGMERLEFDIIPDYHAQDLREACGLIAGILQERGLVWEK